MAKRVYITEFDANGKPYFNTLDRMEKKTRDSAHKMDESFKKIGVGIAAYFGGRELLQFANDAVQLASKMQGVKKAFDSVSSSGTLERLRKATRDAVSDFQLMQASVKANNFKIPLDLLAKGLEFANKRAIQTGDSVDYMVDSFITGVARKSIPILDNLGISQLELNKEVEKTGDFYKAIGNIVERENEKMAGAIDTTTEKLNQLNVKIENHKLEIGNKLIPVYERLLELTGLLLDNYEKIGKYNPTTGFAFQTNQITEDAFREKWNKTLENSWFNIGGGTPKYFLQPMISGLRDDRNLLNDALNNAKVGGKLPPPKTGTGNGKVDNSAWQYYLSNLSAVDQPDANAKGLMRNVYTPPWVGEMNETIVPELQDKFEVIGDSFVNKFGELNNIAHSFSNVLGIGADTFVGKIIAGIDTASQILGIISGIINISSGGVTSLFGLAEGGTVVNKHGKLSYVPIPKFARGGSYVVPPGYSNDSGLIRVQSGERVDVTPSSQVPILSKTLNEIKSAILAGNMNSARKGKQPMLLNLTLDGEKIASAVFGYENNFNKRGVDKTQLRAGRGI